MAKVKRMYKIHCEGVATGQFRQPACNGVFYESRAAAIRAARKHVTHGDNDAMVIYKAILIVRKSLPPVEIIPVDEDGLICSVMKT